MCKYNMRGSFRYPEELKRFPGFPKFQIVLPGFPDFQTDLSGISGFLDRFVRDFGISRQICQGFPDFEGFSKKFKGVYEPLNRIYLNI